MRPFFSLLMLAFPRWIIASRIKVDHHHHTPIANHDHEITATRPFTIVRRQVASFTSPSAPQQTGTISGCTLWAVVTSGDTCETLASAFGIPRSQFLVWNPAVSSNCETNFWLDYAYCVRVGPAAPTTPQGPTFTEGVPCQCNKYHEVSSGDDCQSVATMYGVTRAQFLAWNPAVNSDCGSNFWLGNSYCVGISGETTCPATPTSTTRPPATATGDPAPSGPTHSGIPCQCNNYHTIVSGDTCETLTTQYRITLAQFRSMNPAVNQDCSVNFWLGSSYCVGVTGDPECPVPSSSSELPVTTAGPTPASPTFPNIDCRCDAFYKLREEDTCESITDRFSIELADFLAWNPEVAENCTFNFYVGYSYCVGVDSASACSNVPSSSFTETGINTATDYSYVSGGTKASDNPRPTAIGFPPEPLQPGTPINCQEYYQPRDVDTCMSIAHLFRDQLDENKFREWNPAVGADCDGLLVNYYYCVLAPIHLDAVADATTQYTFEVPAETGFPTPAWNLSEIAVLQQTFSGVATGCPILVPAPTSAGCSNFEETFSVGTSDIQAWNTGVDCASLSAGLLYCVGDPTSPPTSLPTVPPSSNPNGPQPQQEGMVADCATYWFVGGSDTCEVLAEINGVTQADLISWNPVLQPDCDELKSGYFICVEVAEDVLV